MSQDIEPPAPPQGDPDDGLPFKRSPTAAPPSVAGPPSSRGHVMSPGSTSLPRPHTMGGVGVAASADALIPPPPLTEVAPAPEIRRDLGSRPGAPPAVSLALNPEDATATTVSPAPRARPSETMVGALSPLHTAEDANTQIDVSTLTPADADRILAAAGADSRIAPKRATLLTSSSSGLPPPPPLRKSSFPPPSGGEAPATERQPTASPAPPAASPTSVRASYPPPPPHRANTLLMYSGATGAAAAIPRAPSTVVGQSAPRASIQGLLARHAPGDAPKPTATSPSRPPPAPRPRADSVEEISAGMLIDESGGIQPMAPVVPPQAISSSALVADPESAPELEQLEEISAVQVIEPDPVIVAPQFAPSPLPPLSSTQEPTALVRRGIVTADPFAPARQPSNAPAPPHGDVASVEAPVSVDSFSRPTEPALRAADPFSHPTDPPAALDSSSPERPPWLVPAMIAGGTATLLLALGVIVLMVRWIHGAALGTDTPHVAPSAVASAAQASPQPSPSAGSNSAAGAKPHEAPVGGPCMLAGAPHVVAPHALLRAGIETATSSDRIALGVALADRDAFVVALDPSTFALAGSSHAHAAEPLRRVVPILGPSDLTPFLETSGKHVDPEAAHPVAADPPFVVGVSGGKLGWAPSRSVPLQPLWTLDSEAPVEAMRTAVLRNHAGYALAFRQGSSVYLGGLHADKTPNGELVRIGGLGPQVGAPALAAGSDHVLVVWADRASPAMPWAVRSVKWRPGTDPGEPAPFAIPVADASQQVMSPALASLADGRFVIAWTEGTSGRHDVRVEALDSSDRPIGTALTVSAEGVNAGQGMLALTPDGRGAIAFLATPTGPTASVVAVPIICP